MNYVQLSGRQKRPFSADSAQNLEVNRGQLY